MSHDHGSMAYRESNALNKSAAFDFKECARRYEYANEMNEGEGIEKVLPSYVTHGRVFHESSSLFYKKIDVKILIKLKNISDIQYYFTDLIKPDLSPTYWFDWNFINFETSRWKKLRKYCRRNKLKLEEGIRLFMPVLNEREVILKDYKTTADRVWNHRDGNFNLMEIKTGKVSEKGKWATRLRKELAFEVAVVNRGRKRFMDLKRLLPRPIFYVSVYSPFENKVWPPKPVHGRTIDALIRMLKEVEAGIKECRKKRYWPKNEGDHCDNCWYFSVCQQDKR